MVAPCPVTRLDPVVTQISHHNPVPLDSRNPVCRNRNQIPVTHRKRPVITATVPRNRTRNNSSGASSNLATRPRITHNKRLTRHLAICQVTLLRLCHNMEVMSNLSVKRWKIIDKNCSLTTILLFTILGYPPQNQNFQPSPPQQNQQYNQQPVAAPGSFYPQPAPVPASNIYPQMAPAQTQPMQTVKRWVFSVFLFDVSNKNWWCFQLSHGSTHGMQPAFGTGSGFGPSGGDNREWNCFILIDFR